MAKEEFGKHFHFHFILTSALIAYHLQIFRNVFFAGLSVYSYFERVRLLFVV